MKQLSMTMLLAALSILLSGCLYPENERSENQVPYEDQVQSVQTAVNQFKEQNGGILPIKTKEGDPPIYEKYPVEFKKLVPQFLAEPPGNAYESGGIFQYVLTDVEEKPAVKLLDLRLAEQIRDIKIRIQAQGYPPYKEEIAENVYSLDYKKLGYKEDPFVVSPYSSKNLPLVISGGEIYVDYRSDLYEALQNQANRPVKGSDIRHLLLDDSLFVPAYSLPLTVDEKNEPVFMAQ